HALELWDWFASIGEHQHPAGIQADMEQLIPPDAALYDNPAQPAPARAAAAEDRTAHRRGHLDSKKVAGESGEPTARLYRGAPRQACAQISSGVYRPRAIRSKAPCRRMGAARASGTPIAGKLAASPMATWPAIITIAMPRT